MDIVTFFNLLLGPPRIQSAGAILSSAHQKVKFISGNKTVMVEEEIRVPASTMVPFINTHQVDPASRYHSFDFVSVNYIPEGKTFLEPKLYRCRINASHYFMKCQNEPGIGLGKFGTEFSSLLR